jgi:4-hydroxybenzoate polyprenyltransferase
MKTLVNYFGQIRIYSLIDYLILLIASGASAYEFTGVLLMHTGFLAYLESRHKHSYRKSVPKYLWIFLTVIGVVFYDHYIFALLFIICSILYTLKTRSYFGIFAPAIRALQYFIIIGGITGFQSQLPWIALLVIFIRNFAGDLRDVEKDSRDNMKTLPISMGLKRGTKYIHLITILLTTTIWWTYTGISLVVLLPILLIQGLSYNLTPR